MLSHHKSMLAVLGFGAAQLVVKVSVQELANGSALVAQLGQDLKGLVEVMCPHVGFEQVDVAAPTMKHAHKSASK